MATQKGRNWSNGDIVTAANLSSIERGVSAVAEEYTPTTWANGDTVTAAALNNIEQGIANAGGGSGSWTILTEESVTTAVEAGNLFARGELVYSGRITADTIKVTFNDVEYTVPVFVDTAPFGTVYLYGAQYSSESHNYDFSVYPFSIQSIQSMQGDNALNNIFTETAGTYSIKIEAPAGGGSSDFSTAEITLNDGSNEVTIYGAFTFENLQIPPANGTRSSNRFSNTVVLYKGYAIIELDGVPEGYSVSTSGDISQLGGRSYALTGDCTITISNSSGGQVA